ncbi:MAG: hypothetical protein IPK63_21255 [Candidatus Competibacteraceae bacterium]|nr:hypothetical protein [Candidatus Competibacteraceae bacterium]
MFIVINKILSILSPKERAYLYLLFLALVCLAGIELLGVASIMPFMAVVANPDVIYTNRWLKLTYDFFGFTNLQGFLFFLGMIVLGLLVFSNLFKALTTYWTLKHDNGLNCMLARRLLTSYLTRPYEFFLNRNTFEMGKNVLAEVRNVIALILSPIMEALSGALVSFLFYPFYWLLIPPLLLVLYWFLGSIPCYIFSSISPLKSHWCRSISC